nr:transposase [Paludibacteraceae bacterium]
RHTDKLGFAINASFASVNVAKLIIKQLHLNLSIGEFKKLISSQFLIRRILSQSGIFPNQRINTKIVKELLDFTANAT